jgi:diguanylate cyclase (GGDEF)-like protein
MSSDTKSAALKYARLEQLTASIGLTMASGMILAIILVYVLLDSISQTKLSTWLFIFISLSIVRLIVMLKHKRNPPVTDELVNKQLTQFRIGLIASGVLWGIASVVLFPANALSHQMFFMFILAGLTAGCVVSYSADFISAISYILLILIPMQVRLFLGGSDIALPMMIAVLLYISFMIASIRYVNRNLLRSISAKYDATKREQEIQQLAFYDELTNLPNRRLMIDRINHALILSARTGRGGALLFLDLDNFKLLNDTLGHDMGDLLLKQVAERLVSCVRTSDTVARLGGDEFTVMLEDLSQDIAEAGAQTDDIAKKIIVRLNLPYQLNAHQYHATASIGVAMFGEDGSTQEELLKNADVAMYKAKRSGRNTIRYFDLGMQAISNAQATSGECG